MPEVKNFTDWLSFHPSIDEIVHALTTEYFAEFGVEKIYFCAIESEESVHSFGFIPSSKEKWAADSKTFVFILRDHGLIQGYLVIDFVKPITHDDKGPTELKIEELCSLVSLYLSLQNRKKISTDFGATLFSEYRESAAIELSARQLSILAGMVEGKTNHELAIELGFSTSTVRHESMRIYNLLAVSDRKEAAKKAIALKLL